MKTILCFGDSNTWGAKPLAEPSGSSERFGANERWAGVMRNLLNPDGGQDYWVIEEGLNGRTTVHDDPVEGRHKNGARMFTGCLESHHPIDLVVVMLGTNDLKSRFAQSAADIAGGAGALVQSALDSPSGPGDGPPQVLLVCPPPLRRLTALVHMFAGGSEKSLELSTHFHLQADRLGCHLLDAGLFSRSSDIDGIHWDGDQHAAFGRAMAGKVREIL